jgi:hypothetical protein
MPEVIDSPAEGQEEQETSEQQVEISEEEQQEQVKALLNTETTEEPEAETQTEVEEQTEVIPEAVFTDEIIDKYPALKMFRGKTITEIAPAYQKIVSKYQDLIRLYKELEGKLEKTSLTDLGEPPDPIENRAEFDKWLKKRDELVRSQVKPAEQSTTNPMMEVQARLPGVDVNKVADEWAKFNSDMLFDETGNLRPEIEALYKKNPELMVESIVKHYNIHLRANQNETEIEKKAKAEAYKKTKENFKMAQKTKSESSQINSIQRTSDLTPEDEILGKIYQSALSG